MERKNNISGTKKAVSKTNDFVISFKKDIRRSPNPVEDEHEHLICAFPLRLRCASATTHKSNHLCGATNINDLNEIKKQFDKKIRDWQKGGDINLGDFMMFIALELRFRASESNDKKHSYYVSVYESHNKYTLRISDHHFDTKNALNKGANITTSVTFSTPYDNDNHENWDFFKPDEQVKAIEYVYYESAIDKEKLIAIAKDVFDFLRTGTYIPSVKPNEIHNSPIYSLDGLCGLDGVSNAQFEDYKKGINDYYKPYSFSTANKIYLSDTNLVAGYIKRAASHMSPEQTKELLNFVREKETEIYNKYKKHIFTDRHSVWKLVDFSATEEQKNNERKSREDITLELTNCKVELSYTDDRLRIMFDSIPTDEQRNMLKHIGFRWSPSNKAWQRQLTDRAIIAIVSIYTSSKYDWLLTTEDRVKIKSAYAHPEHKQPQPEQPKPEPKYKVGDWFQTDYNLIRYFKVIEPYITDSQVFYKVATYNINLHVLTPLTSCKESDLDAFKKLPEQPLPGQPLPEQPQPEQPKANKKPLIYFAFHLSQAFKNGESFDWTKAQKFAEQLNIEATQQELMQACELGVVLAARQIAHKDASLAERFAALKDLYEQQVTIRPLDTQSKILQQYSTPCPLAFLLGEYVKHRQDIVNATYLEPTAGNGMLTIALDADKTTVNELDEIRYKNLHAQLYNAKLNEDANKLSLPDKHFDGVITNPPFAKLADSEKISRNGWVINTLDYKLSVLALDKMKDTGRAAIIVGGKMWNNYWKPLSDTSDKKVLFGQWKTFLGYLYAQYNVVDVIYVNGDNIYRKQGTQYPIVIILINGRHEYNESNKPNYVFDPERDVIIDTYDQLFDRMMKHLAKEADDDHKPKYKVGDWFIEKVKHYESYETYYKIIGIHRDKKVLYDIDGYDDSGNPLYHFLELEESYIDDNYTLIDLPKFIKHKHLILAKARAKAMVMLQEQRNRETKANNIK